jgi:hypothetical protein
VWVDKGHVSESTIAAVMRQALDQAEWSPDGDPEVAIAALLALCAAVGSMVTDDVDPDDLIVARIVFDSEALAGVYMFSGEVLKTVNQQHPARPAEYVEMPRAEFVESVVRVLPHFHRRQREVSNALDQAFPREPDSAAG